MKLAKPNMQALLQPSALLFAVAIFAALILGIFANGFTDFAYQRLGVMLALPGALLLGFLFLFDRYTLFLLIILSRSMLDPIFDRTKLGSFGLGAALNGLVILIAVIALFQNSEPVRRVVRSAWMPFLTLFGIAFVMAPEFIPGLKSYLAIISYASMFALALVLVKTHEDYAKWMKAILLSSIIPVLYGFYMVAAGMGRGAEGMRINSTFSHFNIFAFYLVLMVTVAFYFLKSPVSYISPTVRRLLPFYICMMLVMLLFTKTRSAWVAAFAFFAVYSLFYDRKYLLLVFLAPVVALLIPDVRDRVLDLTQNNEVYTYSTLNSYAWRKYIWESGFNWMQPSHYFFGYGAESFMHYSLDFFPLAGGIQRGAHSVYVQLFFESGLFGIMAFAWLFLRLGAYLMPYYREHKLMIFSAIMLLIEYAIFAYSDNMLEYLNFNWYFWFTVGAAYSFAYHQRKLKQAEAVVEKQV